MYHSLKKTDMLNTRCISKTDFNQSKTYQLAHIVAPDLSSTRMFRHEGDAVQLREEAVQTLHTGTQRQVRTVQTGLYVVPETTEK